MFTNTPHECNDPNHKPYPHHHGVLGEATNHRNPGCPWECGQDVYTKFAVVKNVEDAGNQVVMPNLSTAPLPDYEAFEADVQKIINYHSMENGSNTPDYILAAYLTAALKNYDKTMRSLNHHSR